MKKIDKTTSLSLAVAVIVFLLLVGYLTGYAQFDLIAALIVSSAPALIVGLVIWVRTYTRQQRLLEEAHAAEIIRRAQEEADELLQLQRTVETIRKFVPEVKKVNPYTAKSLDKLCDHATLVGEKVREKLREHRKSAARSARSRIEPLATRVLAQYLEMSTPSRHQYFPGGKAKVAQIEATIAELEQYFRGMVTLLEKEDLDNLELDLRFMNSHETVR